MHRKIRNALAMKRRQPVTFAFYQKERFPLEKHHLLCLFELAGISFAFQELPCKIACVVPERKTLGILFHKLGRKCTPGAYGSMC